MQDLDSTGCYGCRFLPSCGGWRDDPADFYGCFDQCRVVALADGRSGCADGRCELTCPNNPRLFRLRDMEVKGLGNTDCGPLLPLSATRLPPYLPYIRCGLPQSKTLDVGRVAINLYEAVARLRVRGTSVRYREMSALDFRRRLRLRDDCEILLIGVAPDPLIESFWSRFTKEGFAHLLAPLNVLGVTVPNFSFALDVTRHEHFYSRRRIILLAEEFSAANIPVALHINAANRQDWRLWAEIIKATPALRTVCQEFGTGLAAEEAAKREVSWMLWLEEQIGRRLHPILVGGGRHMDLMRSSFASYTIVSATPYMRAVKRRRAEGWTDHGRPHWERVASLPGECLTGLLKHNIDADERWTMSPAQPAT